MAMNALLGGKHGSGGSGGSGSSSSPLGGLASQFLGGSHGGGGSGGKNSSAGKLVGQLASSMFSSSNKPDQPSNYHGGQSSGHGSHQGGLAGSVIGGVAHMFGGKPSGSNVCYLFLHSISIVCHVKTPC